VDRSSGSCNDIGLIDRSSGSCKGYGTDGQIFFVVRGMHAFHTSCLHHISGVGCIRNVVLVHRSSGYRRVTGIGLTHRFSALYEGNRPAAWVTFLLKFPV
jgi:hypothetical protein